MPVMKLWVKNIYLTSPNEGLDKVIMIDLVLGSNFNGVIPFRQLGGQL